jgi:hypothetical protein
LDCLEKTGVEIVMIKSVTILFIVAIVSMMLVCVIPVSAQENSLNIIVKGSPEKVSPGELITYDIWYDAQVYGDWFADHIWLFFIFDPRIDIISVPSGLMGSGVDWSGDFTPGLNGNGKISELIGGTFIGKIKDDTLPGSIITTTAEIWNCLEPNTAISTLKRTANELDPYFVSAKSTSITTVEPVQVPEFPNPVPIIVSSIGILTVVLLIKKN